MRLDSRSSPLVTNSRTNVMLSRKRYSAVEVVTAMIGVHMEGRFNAKSESTQTGERRKRFKEER